MRSEFYKRLYEHAYYLMNLYLESRKENGIESPVTIEYYVAYNAQLRMFEVMGLSEFFDMYSKHHEEV